MSNNLELYLNSDNTMHRIFVSNVTNEPIYEKEEVAQLESILIRLPRQISLDELKKVRLSVDDTENILNRIPTHKRLKGWKVTATEWLQYFGYIGLGLSTIQYSLFILALGHLISIKNQ